MGRARQITRRALLIGSVAVAGGAAFGVWSVRRPHPNPLLPGLGPGEAALTPYVRIDAAGVTLITPRADVGQGAWHVQALLLAEELDVDPGAVRVDPGPPAPAYWNTALAPQEAEFAVPGDGVLHDAAEGALGAMMKLMGMQITGGSTTVPDGYVKLRAAGASARETLKRAAAERAGVDVARLETRAGHVILPDGTRIPYADLAALVAGVEPVQDVPLRAPADWRLIGQAGPRLDMAAKCTGTQTYGIDVDLPGMVHAAVRLNPAQGGDIEGFDASAAEAMPGVRAVLPVTGGVAAVADNTWRAFRALDAVEVRWGKAPLPGSMEDHWSALSAAFAEDSRDSRKRDDGDVEAALADDGAVVAEYRAPYLAHAPLEPPGAVVRIDDAAAEVWTGTQVPRFVRKNVARIAGLPVGAVTVHAPMSGGSFGQRLEDDAVRRAAEVALRMPGVPVKLTYAREEDMRRDYPRPIAMARLRGRVVGGRVDTLDLSIAMPSVVASQMGRQGLPVPGPDSQIVAGAWNAPFAIPNHRVTGYRARGLAPVSSWRSVGASTNGFFWNAAFDELAQAAGADPMEERLRLCDDPRARAVLEAAAEMSDWQGARPGPGRGRGVALVESFGVPCAEVVEVRDTGAGIAIERVWVAAEVGRVIDPVNFENQVQGAAIWGLGHAMNCEIAYEGGIAEPDNFHAHDGMRIWQVPAIEVRGLETGDRVTGIGEPPVPPAAPALAGAIFAATGQRLREMPFARFVDFV